MPGRVARVKAVTAPSLLWTSPKASPEEGEKLSELERLPRVPKRTPIFSRYRIIAHCDRPLMADDTGRQITRLRASRAR